MKCLQCTWPCGSPIGSLSSGIEYHADELLASDGVYYLSSLGLTKASIPFHCLRFCFLFTFYEGRVFSLSLKKQNPRRTKREVFV
jgi:hypothetical protein